MRTPDDIAVLVEAAYGGGIDAARLIPGLRLVAAALDEGDVVRASIAALQLQLGAIDDDRLERLARADSLLKRNFDPNQPRVPAGNPDGGQWTDAEGTGTGAAGESGDTAEVGSGASDIPGSAGRVWERFPNAEFRNQLAIAENSAHKPNFGYGDVNPDSDALGPYQMTLDGLKAAGMKGQNGHWTGKYGIHSREQFLADPEAQEKALTDLLNETQRQLRAFGAMGYIGSTVAGLRARFTITGAGLLAAAHREGAEATRRYLMKLRDSGFSSSRARLTIAQRRIETRLRTFAEVPYRQTQ
ncbi:MAG: hypothetical protein AB7H71_14740 [Alphaproteobacteria bacterium]